ncbi:MAG: hypothetical protein O2985_13735 [Proteobacteria bacterium]|nr:hypothetical protein [Pseudomonadota bacterium]
MSATEENTGAKPPATEAPVDLFSLLSSFASRMAVLSSISGQERFWEDPVALKVGLSTYANARFLRHNLTTQMELAESANGQLLEQIKIFEKSCATLDSEIDSGGKKLRGLETMIARDEEGDAKAESPMRPRRTIQARELAENREELITKRRLLREFQEKHARVKGELDKARVVNDRFLGLFEDCFEKWDVFDEETLKNLAENGPTEEIRDMVRAAVEAEPDKIVNITRTDWHSFRRSLDMFVVDSMLETEAEVVVLTDGTLRKIRDRTENVQKRVMQHVENKLSGGAWTEVGQLAEDWEMAPEAEAYRALDDRVKMFIEAATLARAGEFISPSMQQQILIGIVEWLQAGVYQGYTSFGKDAGFNTLMITVDVFYMLYQWRAVPYEYKGSGGGMVYTTVNAIHVFELDLIFCDAGGTEIEHELHEDAKKRLKEQEVDLRRHSTVDGEAEEEEQRKQQAAAKAAEKEPEPEDKPAPNGEAKSALLDRLKGG